VLLICSLRMRWWVAVDWIDDIIREGSARAEEVEVYFTKGTTISAELKRNIVEVATESRSQGLGIRIIDQGRIGASTTNDPGRWRECLEAALASGRLATPQAWHGLPSPRQIEKKAPNCDPSLVPDAGTAKRLLGRMLEGASQHPVDVTGGSADLSRVETTIANSSGIRYSDTSTHVSISLETIREQSTGNEFTSSMYMDVDPVWVGERAGFLAARSLKGSDIETGVYDVILSPIAAAQLIGAVLVPALSGRNVHAGRSWLKDKLGERCFDECLQISDDPFAKGLGSTNWDDEGMPTKRLDFVRDGVLEQFAYDLKTAYRYGKQSTASAVRSGYGGAPAIGMHNLVVDGKRSNVAEERGIFVHSVVGAHTANAMSGDFSVECSNAFWMEGGEYQEPIRKAMLAGNVFAMLSSVGGLGTDTRAVGTVILPSIRLNGQHIIGK
jgi:PmbA protein